MGSDRDAIRALIDGQRRQVSVPLSVTQTQGRVRVATGELKTKNNLAHITGTLWFVPVYRSRQVDVRRGENKNRALTNIARSLNKIGDWNGTPSNFEFDAAALSPTDSDGYVVILQAGVSDRPGPILAAYKNW